MKVLLLAGGDSNEREVSLTSGRAVFGALRKLGHTVLAIDSATGRSLLAADGSFTECDSSAYVSTERTSPLLLFDEFMDDVDLSSIDVVFIALHGGSGENGSIQNILEMAGVKYTGSSMTACAISMDKAITKRLCQSENITTPKWQLIRIKDGKVTEDIVCQITDNFTMPIIVKPNDGGSTVGLSKVEKSEEILDALNLALKESPNILIEQYISGREITVTLMDSYTFPVVEIVPKNGLYDYEAKYTDGGSDYVCPAEIPKSVAVGVQEAAAKLFDLIGCSGLARVDFILSDDGTYYCLELNSVPGMTNLSLAPMAANADGVEFNQLMQMTLDSALTGC